MRLQARTSRHKAFLSFEAMFAMIPALLMLTFALGSAHSLSVSAAERMDGQQVFDKLVSIADYAVKQGAVRTGAAGTDQVRYPNWIDESMLDGGSLARGLRQEAGLAELSIQLDDPGPGAVCVYRLVVIGDNRERIAKLFVCGE